MMIPPRPLERVRRRMRWIAAVSALGPLLLLSRAVTHAQGAQGGPADLLIRNGRVIDGTGAAARTTDIAITGDRITFVGDAAKSNVTARRTIDARGLIVAPGFIDPHTHALEDLSSNDPKRRANVDYLMQGVTTVITGNDGGGPYEVARTLEKWRADGIGSNGALLVGYGTVRQAVMKMSDVAAAGPQLDSMRALVDKGMREGALGMSTGLYYAPQSYSTTEEVIEMAKVAARQGGIYDTHLRDESSYTVGLLGAIRETIRIGREAGMPVHISHIKALGTDVWGRSDSAIAIIEAAQAGGQKVTANQYPYTASGSSVGASLLPRWAEVGGRDSLRARVADAATKARLVTDMTENLRRRGGAAALLISSTRDTSILGKTLEQVAKARNIACGSGDSDRGGGGCVGGVVQHEREGHRGVHAPPVGHDGLRRLVRPSAEVRDVPEEVGGVRAGEEDPDARSVRESLERVDGGDVRHQGSWRAGEREVRGRRGVRRRGVPRSGDVPEADGTGDRHEVRGREREGGGRQRRVHGHHAWSWHNEIAAAG